VTETVCTCTRADTSKLVLTDHCCLIWHTNKEKDKDIYKHFTEIHFLIILKWYYLNILLVNKSKFNGIPETQREQKKNKWFTTSWYDFHLHWPFIEHFLLLMLLHFPVMSMKRAPSSSTSYWSELDANPFYTPHSTSMSTSKHHALHPEDAGRKILWNAGNVPHLYMASQCRWLKLEFYVWLIQFMLCCGNGDHVDGWI